MSVLASYSGQCPLCLDAIRKGRSRVEKLPRPIMGKRWAHTRCVDSLPMQRLARMAPASRELE